MVVAKGREGETVIVMDTTRASRTVACILVPSFSGEDFCVDLHDRAKGMHISYLWYPLGRLQ